jgi:hypothetical protein
MDRINASNPVNPVHPVWNLNFLEQAVPKPKAIVQIKNNLAQM